MRFGDESGAVAHDGHAVDKGAVGQRVVGLQFDDVEAELAQRDYEVVVLLHGLVNVDGDLAAPRRLVVGLGLRQARRHAAHNGARVLEVERIHLCFRRRPLI